MILIFSIQKVISRFINALGCFYVQSEWAYVLCKCTDYYATQFEGSLNWSDPALAIEWPLIENISLVLSDKDRNAPYGNHLIFRAPYEQADIR